MLFRDQQPAKHALWWTAVSCRHEVGEYGRKVSFGDFLVLPKSRAGHEKRKEEKAGICRNESHVISRLLRQSSSCLHATKCKAQGAFVCVPERFAT